MKTLKQYVDFTQIIAFQDYKRYIKILKLYGQKLSQVELLKKLQKINKE